MLPKCTHAHYNSFTDGDPSRYCSGCTSPSPIVKPAKYEEAFSCPACGDDLAVNPDDPSALGCSSCGYDGTEV